MVEIGSRIRDERIRNGYTQEQLAYDVSISAHHISNIERGKNEIKLENLIKICDVFGTSIDYIVRGEKPSPEEGIYSILCNEQKDDMLRLLKTMIHLLE